MENTNEIMEVVDVMPEVNDALANVPTVEEAVAANTNQFGVKEGLVLGFMVLGTAAIGYSAYDLLYAKLFKKVIKPKMDERASLKAAMMAGEASVNEFDEAEEAE